MAVSSTRPAVSSTRPHAAAMFASLRCPKCGRLEWVGRGRMVVGAPDGPVCVVAEPADGPEWRYNASGFLTEPGPLGTDVDRACDFPPQPSPKLVALIDRAIATWRSWT